MPLEYSLNDELGDAGFFWRDSPNGPLVDLSTGYTYALKIYDGTGATWFTKTTGITGAAGSLTATPNTPNVTIAWATTGELSTITTPGTYPLRLVATRTADSKTRTFRSQITILPLI